MRSYAPACARASATAAKIPALVRVALVTMSTSIAAIPRSDLTFRALPLPPPKGGENAYPAELMGFALLGGADTEAAEGFLQWLWQGRGHEMALAAGLVPIADAYTGAGRDSAFGELLIRRIR